MSLPLANHPLWRTQTIDEAASIFHGNYGSARIEPSSQTGRFRWDANGVSLGGIAVIVGTVHEGVHISSKAGIESVILITARKGQGELRQHGQEHFFSQRLGIVIAPRRETDLIYQQRCDTLNIRFEYTTLVDTLYALTGVRLVKPLEFDTVVDHQTSHGGEIFRFLDFMLQTLDREPSPLSHPLVLNNLQNAFITGFLCTQSKHFRQIAETGVVTPSVRAVQRAEAYLDAHADKPITMAELQGVTGMSIRSLQSGFMARRGCTPMQFLRERRLLLARQRLQNPGLGTKVAEVAYSCGFVHLGRFSREYSKRFGEKPSETLERALLDIQVVILTIERRTWRIGHLEENLARSSDGAAREILVEALVGARSAKGNEVGAGA